jgi:single-strand DNA-binding protein
MAGASDTAAHPQLVNEVRLVGRLAAAPQQRQLPSGDVLVTFRLVVPRADSGRRRGARPSPSVDTIDCACWGGNVRRVVSAWQQGEWVEVRGALWRRFWRGPHGPVSRCEVAVSQARRVRAGPPAGRVGLAAGERPDSGG